MNEGNGNALSWFDELDANTQRIVSSDDNFVCIQAGPGTGKSFCIKCRCQYALATGRCRPDQLLLVTFTKAAAADLRKDIDTALGAEFPGYRVSTLHSLCLEILRNVNFAEHFGRDLRFLKLESATSTVYGFEAEPMFADIKYALRDAGSATVQTDRIKAMQSGWSRDELASLAMPVHEQDSYEAYLLRWMVFHKCMLTDELIPLALAYLRSTPDSPWLSRFKFIVVDEYQDLNRAEQELIKILSQRSKVTIVGDVDQSIYSFRFARPEGLPEVARLPNVTNFELNVCRRNPALHTKAAQACITKNIRKDRVLPSVAAGSPNGIVFNRRWFNEENLLEGVVQFVKHCRSQGVKSEEILLLVSKRELGYMVQQALEEAEIHSSVNFGQGELEDKSIQKLFAMLNLIENPYDRVSLRFLLHRYKPAALGEYEQLIDFCEANGEEPFDVLQLLQNQSPEHDLVLPNTTKKFTELVLDLEQVRDLEGVSLLRHVCSTEKELEACKNRLRHFLSSGDISRVALREYLTAVDDEDTDTPRAGTVRIMSFFKAKGLTCQACGLIGLMQFMLPRPYKPKRSTLASEHQHLEEQRRLFYVGLTRSKKILLLCSVKHLSGNLANRWGLDKNHIESSRFLLSLPIPDASSSLEFKEDV